VTGSTVWRLTLLMLSPVTHCHTGDIFFSVAESIKINLSQIYMFSMYTIRLSLNLVAIYSPVLFSPVIYVCVVFIRWIKSN